MGFKEKLPLKGYCIEYRLGDETRYLKVNACQDSEALEYAKVFLNNNFEEATNKKIEKVYEEGFSGVIN